MSVIGDILYEKYKPKRLETVILLDRVMKIVATDDVNHHYLFSGSQGIGKTTVAKLLANNHPSLYINCSLDRGIDTIRETLIDFCSTQALLLDDEMKDTKIIIMDEIDGATNDFFKALRATMDAYPKVRFIATCNYLNKVPPPIKSRFILVEFEPEDYDEEKELFDKYKIRIDKISKKLKLEWENDDTLERFVRSNFPDFRTMLNKIQKYIDTDITVVSDNEVKITSYMYEDLYKLITSKWKNDIIDSVSTYKFVATNYVNKEDRVISTIFQEFPTWFIEKFPNEQPMKLAGFIVLIAEWQYKMNFLNDKLVGLLALVFEMQKIFVGKK